MTPEEAELWNRLAQSVDKAKGKPRVASHAATEEVPPTGKVRPGPVPAPARISRSVSATPNPPSPPPQQARVPPLVEVDRRAARQLSSGKVPIDARLDLHGARRRDARAQLQGFLFACQARGCKTVLVITGKGSEAANRDHLADALGETQRGVLRRLVPQWLADPELRSVVLSYSSAGVRHGGEGALYVQLRRGAN